jgi:hypothetical protein
MCPGRKLLHDAFPVPNRPAGLKKPKQAKDQRQKKDDWHYLVAIMSVCTKQILCLANSRRPSGHCVAGRELAGGKCRGWIRPVSARPTLELSVEERQYRDGAEPNILDIVAMELQEPRPDRHQQENYLIAPNRVWTKQGRMSWQELQQAVEEPAGSLWLDGHSSYSGENDRVPEDRLDSFSRSLYLVRPENLVLFVARESRDGGPARRRVRARFKLNGCSYCMAVTDPVVEGTYLARDDDTYTLNQALLCVSLSQVFEGHAYKLVATVITPRRASI